MKGNWLPIGAAVLALAASAASARILDPSKPADALEINKRTGCGARDGEPAVYYWSGKIYSRVDGEPDRPPCALAEPGFLFTEGKQLSEHFLVVG